MNDKRVVSSEPRRDRAVPKDVPPGFSKGPLYAMKVKPASVGRRRLRAGGRTKADPS
jgi:hypothetical protein